MREIYVLTSSPKKYVLNRSIYVRRAVDLILLPFFAHRQSSLTSTRSVIASRLHRLTQLCHVFFSILQDDCIFSIFLALIGSSTLRQLHFHFCRVHRWEIHKKKKRQNKPAAKMGIFDSAFDCKSMYCRRVEWRFWAVVAWSNMWKIPKMNMQSRMRLKNFNWTKKRCDARAERHRIIREPTRTNSILICDALTFFLTSVSHCHILVTKCGARESIATWRDAYSVRADLRVCKRAASCLFTFM